MVDVTVKRAFFFSRGHKDGIDADNPVPFSNHLDLFITDVALDIVVPASVRVRNNHRIGCNRENLFKPGRVNMGNINNHAEGFAFTYDLATKRCETLSRRTVRCENSAMA